MKKIFLGILIFLIISLSVNAVVVEDIQQDIKEGNADILRSNAELTAQITSLKTEVISLREEITTLKTSSISKEDLPAIYGNIQQLNREANGQQLATNLTIIAFAFCLLFISKARGWL